MKRGQSRSELRPERNWRQYTVAGWRTGFHKTHCNHRRLWQAVRTEVGNHSKLGQKPPPDRKSRRPGQWQRGNEGRTASVRPERNGRQYTVAAMGIRRRESGCVLCVKNYPHSTIFVTTRRSPRKKRMNHNIGNPFHAKGARPIRKGSTHQSQRPSSSLTHTTSCKRQGRKERKQLRACALVLKRVDPHHPSLGQTFTETMEFTEPVSLLFHRAYIVPWIRPPARSSCGGNQQTSSSDPHPPSDRLGRRRSTGTS